MKERPVPDRGVLVRPNDLAVLDAEASVTGQLGQALHRPGSVPSTPCSSRMRNNGPVVSCEWCRTPIHEGEARLRFFAIAYHLGCWDASVEALIVPPRRQE
jgi:hypothetical protein